MARRRIPRFLAHATSLHPRSPCGGLIMISPSELRILFSYDAASGSLIWNQRASRNGPINCGDVAGYAPADDGVKYCQVSIRYRKYQLHHVVWAWHHGEYPAQFIDHINGNRLDNRIENLRLASPTENCANSRKQANGRAPYKGVYWKKSSNRWAAKVQCRGVPYFLGSFDTPEEAQVAYIEKATELFGPFARAA
jgi:hypothetical protein